MFRNFIEHRILENRQSKVQIFNKRYISEITNKIIDFQFTKANSVPYVIINENLKKNGVLFYSHGNAEEIAEIIEDLNFLSEKLNLCVVSFDYFNTGIAPKSNEKPSKFILENSKEVFETIKEKFKSTPFDVYQYGRSLGTQVAIYLSYLFKTKILILESAFVSCLKSMNYFLYIPEILLKFLGDCLDCTNFLKNLKCEQALIFHTKKDEVINYNNAVEIGKLVNCKKQMYIFDKGQHNTLFFFNKFDIVKIIKLCQENSTVF